MIFVNISLIIINLILWIVFAVKFKSFFSTEEVLEQTRTELNEMLSSINKNAERNIQLIDSKIKELKFVTAESDRRLKILKKEMYNYEVNNEFKQNTNSFISKDNSKSKINKARSESNSEIQNSLFNEDELKNDKIINDELKNNPIKTDEIKAVEENSQSEINERTQNEIDFMTQMQQADNALARAQRVGNPIPEFFKAEKPISVKKDFKTEVLEMYKMGLSPQEIAERTSRSIQEVNLAIKFD